MDLPGAPSALSEAAEEKTMRLAALLLASLTLIAACGGDDDVGSDTAATGDREQNNVVEVGLTEYSFEMPDEVPGGVVTFGVTNVGSQPHEMGFVALEESRGLQDIEAALEKGGFPDWAEDMAGIPVVSPGLETSMTRDLAEGTYAFLCFLPTPEGAPHAMEGMVKVFEVVGGSDAELPEPDLVITASDDGFEVPQIEAGTYTIDLVNEGSKSHEFALMSFEPGKKEKDLGRWFRSGYEGETPAVFPGGMQSIEPGTKVMITVTFESGRTYVLEDYGNGLRTDIKIG